MACLFRTSGTSTFILLILLAITLFLSENIEAKTPAAARQGSQDKISFDADTREAIVRLAREKERQNRHQSKHHNGHHSQEQHSHHEEHQQGSDKDSFWKERAKGTMDDRKDTSVGGRLVGFFAALVNAAKAVVRWVDKGARTVIRTVMRTIVRAMKKLLGRVDVMERSLVVYDADVAEGRIRPDLLRQIRLVVDQRLEEVAELLEELEILEMVDEMMIFLRKIMQKHRDWDVQDEL
ncbi:hypothetical protein BJ508DRAFT_307798 [Ascobolus immersus RN42]|uniref:Transmembrane protein n=1 Tax=Ascobolus immersus RN42 TaxID=1160509 RepID=A0A3N4I3N3_ASCIM|nr:hypothetical protein BJ508DRAFT_307798 [Ascobolus immersus RN42]